MKWSLRPQRLKARILHIVTLTTNLVMIRAFAQHILQTLVCQALDVAPGDNVCQASSPWAHTCQERHCGLISFSQVKTWTSWFLLNQEYVLDSPNSQ